MTSKKRGAHAKIRPSEYRFRPTFALSPDKTVTLFGAKKRYGLDITGNEDKGNGVPRRTIFGRTTAEMHEDFGQNLAPQRKHYAIMRKQNE